ncbi:ribosomal protein S18 [Xylariales sp. PMI_506]|nr:ribosomal protein S18 [Xylariales sp. PMI_506]
MPPRISLFGALSQCQSVLKTQTCQFSKLAPAQAIRRDVPSAANRMLGIDGSDASPKGRAARSSTVGAEDIFNTFRARALNRTNPQTGAPRGVEDELRDKNSSSDYMRQSPRRWGVGEVYAPHDLSAAEARKWRKVSTVEKDLVDMLGLRPLDMYRNFSFISEYTTLSGRIKHRRLTGLRPVNQRKVAKAIRRAIGMGIHPSIHKHPELLSRELRPSGVQASPTMKRGGSQFSV